MTTLLSLIAVTAALASPHSQDRVPLTPSEAAAYGLTVGPQETVWRNADLGNVGSQALDKGAVQLLSLSPFELRGSTSNTFLTMTAEGRYCASGSTGPFADMQLQLADGQRITSMRVWAFDNTASSELTVSLIERCTPNVAPGNVITSVVAAITPALSNGNVSQITAIGANNVIDNDICTYTVRTRFGAVGNDPPCGGSGLRLQKVRFGYELQ